MKKVVNDMRLMVKVCDLYYNQNLSQQEIASQMDLSRPTVSRLIVSARERGIVRISVSNLETIKHWELERRLEQMYHLKEVLLVDNQPTESELKTVLGRAAGRYLESTIKDGSMVGVSMGSTLLEVVNHVRHPEGKNITVVPLVGGMGQLRMELHSNNLAEHLATTYHGTFFPLHAPARVSSPLVKAELMKEKSLAKTLRLTRKLDIALLGIGCPYKSSSVIATGYYKINEIETLEKNHVAGDICMQFFDEDGDTSRFQKDNNVIGLDIHRLREIPYAIGVAGGEDKFSAIKGAIKGGYINILITDIKCAEALAAEKG